MINANINVDKSKGGDEKTKLIIYNLFSVRLKGPMFENKVDPMRDVLLMMMDI